MGFHSLSYDFIGGEGLTLLTAREAAPYLHIGLSTLGEVEKERLLVPFRTPGGSRRYSLEMLDGYLEASSVCLPGWRKEDIRDRRGKETLGFPTLAYRFSSANDALEVRMK